MVSVDALCCEKVGSELLKYKIRESFYNRKFIRFDAARETKLWVYLMSAAICHQTHVLFHPDLNLWGWDYLEHGFLQLVRERNPLLNPGYMSICKNEEVSHVLKRIFSADGNPEHTTLDRIDKRSKMLLELCAEIKTKHDGSITKFLDQAEGKLLNDGKGFYEILAGFSAFSDPQKKKITFFLKLASDAGVLNIKDPKNIIPIMDYHMQRVLLRLGCVKVLDDGLRYKLQNKELINTDEPVRSACIEALRIISDKSGKDILAMNDIFWPLGRSCCNETTLCFDKSCMKSPCTLDETLEIDVHKKCIFEGICKGKEDEQYRKLWEPNLLTHFY
jgi:hypothetical protein